MPTALNTACAGISSVNYGLDTMMIRNKVKIKNGGCSGDLGTDNYCKDTTLVPSHSHCNRSIC